MKKFNIGMTAVLVVCGLLAAYVTHKVMPVVDELVSKYEVTSYDGSTSVYLKRANCAWVMGRSNEYASLVWKHNAYVARTRENMKSVEGPEWKNDLLAGMAIREACLRES